MQDEFDRLSLVAIMVDHHSVVALSVAEDDYQQGLACESQVLGWLPGPSQKIILISQHVSQHLSPPFNRLDRPRPLLWRHHGDGLLFLPPHPLGRRLHRWQSLHLPQLHQLPRPSLKNPPQAIGTPSSSAKSLPKKYHPFSIDEDGPFYHKK